MTFQENDVPLPPPPIYINFLLVRHNNCVQKLFSTNFLFKCDLPAAIFKINFDKNKFLIWKITIVSILTSRVEEVDRKGSLRLIFLKMPPMKS